MFRADPGLSSLTAVLVLAALLRLHGLDRQLWLDEIDALVESQRRPPASIAVEWPRGVSGIAASAHPLYDLAAHASLRLFGESALAVRLPAALLGMAGVGALYFLVRSRLGHAAAFASGLLLAVSPAHVFQSQNARGYTALFFFATVAASFLLRMHGRSTVGSGPVLGYAVAATLGAWSVPFGVFVLPGHALVVAVEAARARARGRAAAWPIRGLARAGALAVLLTGLVYAPLVGRALLVAQEQGRLATSEGGPSPSALYRLGVVHEGASGLVQAFGGPVGGAVALALAALGAWRWWRRDRTSLAVLSLPLAAQAATLLALDVPLSPRYFVLALAVLVVSLGCGLEALTLALSRAIFRNAVLPVQPGIPSVPGLRVMAKAPALLEAAVLAMAVAAAGPPLLRYYRVPKQDFLGARARIESLSRPGNLRVAVHHAGRVLHGYYQAGFEDVQTLAELSALEGQGRRILLVTTLERFLAVHDPGLYRHIREDYRPLQTLEATVAGAEMRLYERALEGGSLKHP